MFVEKLTSSDVEKIAKKLTLAKTYKVVDVKNLSIAWYSGWQVTVVNSVTGGRRTFTLTDYEIVNHIAKEDNERFKQLMYAKFGDEYKTAFNENLRKKYEAEMIK